MTQDKYTAMEREFYQELSDLIYKEQEDFALYMMEQVDMTYPREDDDLPF
jgi:hypothetical protein